MLQGVERHLQLWQEVGRLTGAARNVVARVQSKRCIVQLASVAVAKVLLGCLPVILSVSPYCNVGVRGVGVVLYAAHNYFCRSLAACVACKHAWPVALSRLIVTLALYDKHMAIAAFHPLWMSDLTHDPGCCTSANCKTLCMYYTILNSHTSFIVTNESERRMHCFESVVCFRTPCDALHCLRYT